MLASVLVAAVFLLLASMGFFTMSSALDALKAQVDESVAASHAAVAKVAEVKAAAASLTSQVADLSSQLASGKLGEQDLLDAAAKLKAASDALTAATA